MINRNLAHGDFVRLSEQRAANLTDLANINVWNDDGWVMLYPGDVFMILERDKFNVDIFYVLSRAGICRISVGMYPTPGVTIL